MTAMLRSVQGLHWHWDFENNNAAQGGMNGSVKRVPDVGHPPIHYSTDKDHVMMAVPMLPLSGLARRLIRLVCVTDSECVPSEHVVVPVPAIVQKMPVAVPSFITKNSQSRLFPGATLVRTFKFLSVPVPVMTGERIAWGGLAKLVEADAVLPAVPM